MCIRKCLIYLSISLHALLHEENSMHSIIQMDASQILDGPVNRNSRYDLKMPLFSFCASEMCVSKKKRKKKYLAFLPICLLCFPFISFMLSSNLKEAQNTKCKSGSTETKTRKEQTFVKLLWGIFFLLLFTLYTFSVQYWKKKKGPELTAF